MKKLNTKYKPNILSIWSRCHSSNCNYLLIEETVHIQTSHKSGIKYSQSYGQQVLESYELDKDNRDSQDFIKRSMSKSNVAVKEYSYYRVLYANGLDIICQSYEEFLKLIEEDKDEK